MLVYRFYRITGGKFKFRGFAEVLSPQIKLGLQIANPRVATFAEGQYRSIFS